MRIGFFGTPSLSAAVLENLIESPDIEVVFVVTNPDKSVGRSQQLQSTPVKILAVRHNMVVFTPIKIRNNPEIMRDLAQYECDYYIVVAYGRILPPELLELPKKMCINIHGSILPAYRGASPIQSALLYGEKETGVTIMEMSEGMDEGDILKIRTIAIDPEETSTSLFAKFAQLSGPTLIQTLRELEMGGITPLPQDASQATYCKKIEKEDGLIDWSKSAQHIYQMWQAYTSWPGIYTMYNGKRLLLERVSLFRHREVAPLCEALEVPLGGIDPAENKDFLGVTGFLHPKSTSFGAPSQEGQSTGTIRQVLRLEDGTIGVVCGEGILTLEQVKLEGKKSQSIIDFVNGNQEFIGYNFL